MQAVEAIEGLSIVRPKTLELKGIYLSALPTRDSGTFNDAVTQALANDKSLGYYIAPTIDSEHELVVAHIGELSFDVRNPFVRKTAELELYCQGNFAGFRAITRDDGINLARHYLRTKDDIPHAESKFIEGISQYPFRLDYRQFDNGFFKKQTIKAERLKKEENYRRQLLERNVLLYYETGKVLYAYNVATLLLPEGLDRDMKEVTQEKSIIERHIKPIGDVAFGTQNEPGGIIALAESLAERSINQLLKNKIPQENKEPLPESEPLVQDAVNFLEKARWIDWNVSSGLQSSPEAYELVLKGWGIKHIRARRRLDEALRELEPKAFSVNPDITPKRRLAYSDESALAYRFKRELVYLEQASPPTVFHVNKNNQITAVPLTKADVTSLTYLG